MKGYFRKRGDKWSFTIDIGIDPKTGKRKQKTSSGFKTKKEAQAAAAALQHELSSGTHIDETDMMFKDFAEEWLSLYEKTENVKESTIRVRKHEIKRLLDYFAHIRIKDVTKRMYQEALNGLKDRGYADNTVDGAHSTGRMIFKKAVELDLIKTDPTEFAKVPKTKKTVEELEQEVEDEKYLEKEELAIFLRTAREKGLDRDYPIFMLLSYTGMRAGELCALKWKDINFKEGTISITKTYYNPTNNTKKYKLLPPKTVNSKRTIDIDPVVLAELETHKARQNKIRMRHRDTYYDHDFVIAKESRYPGYPEFIKTIENRMSRLLKLAGLNEELTPHSLRHTHTSLLAEAGVGLQEIMDRLGHKDDDTTKNVYLHVTKTMKKEAAHKFGELMRSL
ncbi:tyrosine-type recombinase/integrase [Ammoniphilus sp. YIM 78166]|uniref:site-specific integrase n=1 Tax=Ammoniphilus sp. YIM 78166 TaxID=1644106 RepID=UPI00107066E9|nr:tyrosine-type recombinase/integrase [Ammoniphilus sp. YIM 78166]